MRAARGVLDGYSRSSVGEKVVPVGVVAKTRVGIQVEFDVVGMGDDVVPDRAVDFRVVFLKVVQRLTLLESPEHLRRQFLMTFVGRIVNTLKGIHGNGASLRKVLLFFVVQLLIGVPGEIRIVLLVKPVQSVIFWQLKFVVEVILNSGNALLPVNHFVILFGFMLDRT